MIDINWTLAAQILNFLILVVLLRAFAYKPIVNMLQERQKKIEMSLAKADEDVEKAEALKKEYEDQLASARVKAQSIIDSASRQAAEERDESVVKTKRDIEQMKKSAAEEIERRRFAPRSLPFRWRRRARSSRRTSTRRRTRASSPSSPTDSATKSLVISHAESATGEKVFARHLRDCRG